MADAVPTNEAPTAVTTETAAPTDGLTAPREGSPLGTPAATPEGEIKPEGEETKPEGEEKPEGEGEAAPLTAEDYAKAITLPEGATVDEGLMGKFTNLAAEGKFSKEQTQSLASLFFEAQDSLVTQLASANQKSWDTVIDGWKAEIAADPVIGNGNEQAVQTTLGKVLDEYGSPEARRAFEVTGAGWNPHIIRMVNKMAQALVEGGPVVPKNPAPPGPKTLGQALYGDNPQPAT